VPFTALDYPEEDAATVTTPGLVCLADTEPLEKARRILDEENG
jgi:hypothetical protein